MEQSDIDLLQTVPPYHLQVVAKARHVQPLSKTPGNASSSGTPSAISSGSLNTIEIAQSIFDSVSIQEALVSLNDIEKIILRELVLCGGRANSRDLALYLTYEGILAPVKKDEVETNYEVLGLTPVVPRGIQSGSSLQYPPAHPHGLFELALRHLLLLGLLFWGRQTNFAGRDYTSGIHDGVLIVSSAVREVVRAQLEMDEDQIASHVGEDVGDAVRAFQRTLYLYWSMVAAMREGLVLVHNGLLSRSALRHVTERMGNKVHVDQVRSESDVPRLLFIRQLMMKLGLLQERRGTIYAAPAEAFFSLPLLERARRCYHLYLETPLWDELLYLPEVNVRPGPGLLDAAHEEVVRSRQAVMERVMHESFGIWHNISAFIARTKLYIPYLLFPRQYGSRAERYSSSSNPYGWDFRLRRGWLTHREGWHMVEGGFVRTVLVGPLHWQGIVDLDREDHPGMFRLLPGAATVISSETSVSEEIPWGRLIVQPNFELIALAPVSEALLVSLDRFAERVSLEHIAQYRLTKASVTRAIQAGLHAETIQVQLERAVGGEIPQNVRYSLQEWERQARRVEVWQGATMVEVEDATLLDALFDDQGTRALFGRRLSPLLAEVAPYQLPAVQEVLWQRDFLPAMTEASFRDGALESGRLSVREPQWRLHNDGLLQPFYAVPDLYLVAEIERFSELNEPTGWYHITAGSLQRALENGLELTYILRFLQQYCEGGIPGSLLIRLKLWGNGYGEKQHITVEHAPLLRLSTQVLQDLQADEELKVLLGSEVEQQSRLVRVETQHLERVIELLRERGFAIDG
jgi:Helicase conserved C-terminal domain